MAAEAGLFLLFFLIGIAITLWVYPDAKKNSPQSAVLWALVAFFGGILGLLLYLLLGRGDSGSGGAGGRSNRAWNQDDSSPGQNSLDGNDGW